MVTMTTFTSMGRCSAAEAFAQAASATTARQMFLNMRILTLLMSGFARHLRVHAQPVTHPWLIADGRDLWNRRQHDIQAQRIEPRINLLDRFPVPLPDALGWIGDRDE